MTATGRGTRGDEGAAGATVRGAILVAVAVIVGVVLLAQGFDDGTLPTTSRTSTETAIDDDDGNNGDGEEAGEDASTTTTATQTTRAPAQVRVQVLNGGGPSGSASATSEALAAARYTPLNAADTADVPVTVVYYAETFEADAAAIATLLSITGPPQALPAEPIEGAAAAGEVDVLVILGPGFVAPG